LSLRATPASQPSLTSRSMTKLGTAAAGCTAG
jgi:hypothetical protein